MFSKNASNNAKGVAIFCVMFFHLVQMKKLPIDSFYSFFATASVSFFLIASGYGLTNSYLKSGINNFFLKRIKAVYIPFALATIILSLVKGFIPGEISSVVRTITFLAPELPVDGTMWYIYYIAVLYVVFYFSFYICERYSINTAFALLMIVAFSVLMYNISLPIKYNLIGTLFSFHAFSFPVGVLLGMIKIKNNKIIRLYHYAIIILFLMMFASLKTHPSMIKFTFTSVLFGLALISIFEVVKVKGAIISFLGAYSYEAYLFEGVLRYNTYSDNYIVNASLFFMLVFAISYSFRALLNMLFEVIKKANGNYVPQP